MRKIDNVVSANQQELHVMVTTCYATQFDLTTRRIDLQRAYRKPQPTENAKLIVRLALWIADCHRIEDNRASRLCRLATKKHNGDVFYVTQ